MGKDLFKQKSPLDVSWYQNKAFVSLSIVKALPIGKDDDLIDIGGGGSTLVNYFTEEGFKNISVLDLSSNALNDDWVKNQRHKVQIADYNEDIRYARRSVKND